jgi:hypothetical protein
MISPDFGLSGREELPGFWATNTETPNGIIVFLAIQNRLFSSAQHLAVSKWGSYEDFTKQAVFGQATMWSKIMSGRFHRTRLYCLANRGLSLVGTPEGGKS